MAFYPSKATKDVLLWMLSTKMMPAVGALMPIYVLSQAAGLLDSLFALTVIFTLSNLPIMVWMLYAGFKDIPKEILDAARMDGASLWQEARLVLLPLAMGGIASTGLLCLVLSWNEAFWSLTLTAAKAGTLAALIAQYSSPEGLFWPSYPPRPCLRLRRLWSLAGLVKAVGTGTHLWCREVSERTRQICKRD